MPRGSYGPSDGVNAMIMKHAGILARTLVAAAAVACGGFDGGQRR